MLKISLKFDEVSIRRKIKDEADRKLKPDVDKMLEGLREATPVDTGEAQSSWKAVKQSPHGWAITNDEDYVKYLNAGSSDQAPANFIERVVLTFGRPKGTVVTYK